MCASCVTCPACGGPRSRFHYLCRTCWYQLPAPTRYVLTLRDDHALARLRALYVLIEQGVPLEGIWVVSAAGQVAMRDGRP